MARSERAQWVRLDVDGVALLADLAAGVSLARVIASDRAQTEGTHTESVGFVTGEPLDAYRTIPQRLLVATLLSIQPTRARDSGESARPSATATDDWLITRAALESAWPAAPDARLTARAAIIRTRANQPAERAAALPTCAPFLTLEAATLLLERGIAHLVLDVPSADRTEEGGELAVHRLFFGLPASSTALGDARRRDCTITELAYIDDAIADGWYLLALQSPAIAGTVVASRPVLFVLRTA